MRRGVNGWRHEPSRRERSLIQDSRILLVATEIPGIGGVVDEVHRVVGHGFLPLRMVNRDPGTLTLSFAGTGMLLPRLKTFALMIFGSALAKSTLSDCPETENVSFLASKAPEVVWLSGASAWADRTH
jgi:hypothetical protein